MNSKKYAFATHNISFSYGELSCIKDITLHLLPGRFYGLIGPNGSGKSTLLDLLSAHLLPEKGVVYLGGKDIRTMTRKSIARRLSSVPQSFSLSFDYQVKDVVMMGRHPYIQRFSKPGETDVEAVETALHALDIHHLRNRNVTQLSGGEKQRVMLARALAQETDSILLDEVTSNLDINHAVSIMRVMLGLVSEQGKTIVAALHDLNIAAAFCDSLLVLREGYLVAEGKTTDILSEYLIEDLYQIRSSVSTDRKTNKKHIKYSYL